MKRVRPPAVAGSFYPADPGVLRAQIAAYLEKAAVVPAQPLAVIAPHAGYVYSGPIAASAYASLSARRNEIHRVVLIGPSHRVGFQGLALPDCDALATPLGEILLDQEGIQKIRRMPGVMTLDHAHNQEHSLEVQLPFLQSVLGDFTLVPLAAGSCAPDLIADVFEALADPGTIFVISTDLSHFLPSVSARQKDAATAAAIEALQSENLGGREACGYVGVSGLLCYAKRHQLSVKAVDLRNSGDTAGEESRVVGYGSFIMEKA